MNKAGNGTSIYKSRVSTLLFPTRAVVRDKVWTFLKTFISFKPIEKFQEIEYKDTKIGFKVRDIPEEYIYMLSFFPYGENVSSWKKEDSERAAKNTLEFCEMIGDNLEIKIDHDCLLFNKIYLDKNNIIDISNWEVSFPLMNPPEKEPLAIFLEEKKNTRYQSVFEKVPKDGNFFIFTQTYLGSRKPIESLRSILEKFGVVMGVKSIVSVKDFAEKFRRPERCAFIFVEEENLLEKLYGNLKVYFDSNRIPTQYVRDSTITGKLEKFSGVVANIILEIFTKMGKPSIFLRPPEEIITAEGFLCLSDIESTTRRLFGALFCYSREGLETEEEVQIYEDVEFTTSEDKIEIGENALNLLAEKIGRLIGRTIRIDILVTKEWTQDNLRKLISTLKEKGVEIEKVYHISSRTSRFVDEYLIQKGLNENNHPYVFIGDKVAFLRTCTHLRLYANLSQIYIKLLYPDSGKLVLEDFEKILWLVKKRIYRIQEFHVLKLPEPLFIFRNIRKMYLGEIRERLSIPLRLLI